MGVGYRYGFAGRESETAFKLTHGCPDYETYFRPIRVRMRSADARLTALQAKMEKRHSGAIEWDRDFFEFIRDERSRGIRDLQDPKEIDAKNSRLQPKATSQHSYSSTAVRSATSGEVSDAPIELRDQLRSEASSENLSDICERELPCARQLQWGRPVGFSNTRGQYRRGR